MSNFIIRNARLPNVKDLHTSFSLGEVKASRALPLEHLAPGRPADTPARPGRRQ